MTLTQISTAGVKDDAVTSGKIPANAVGSSELADNAVDTAAIANDAVNNDKIANSAVNTAQLADSAVHTQKINDDAVTTDKLANSIVNDINANTAKASITINTNGDNRVLTGTGSANTIQGETQLLFDSNGLLYLRAPDGGNRYFFGETANNASAQLSLYNSSDQQKVRIAAGELNAADANTFFNGGNVGIATNSPANKLHIIGTTRINQSSTLGHAPNAGTMFEVRGNSIGSDGVDDDYFKGFKIALNDQTEWGSQAQFAVGRWENSGNNARSSLMISLGHGQANSSTNADTDVLLLKSDGSVIVRDGDLKIGTSGHGIDFSADANASGATSEILDDYEEGSYTSLLNGGNFTADQGYNRYVKIGNIVHVSGRLSNFSSTTNGTDIAVTLPFTCLNVNSVWLGNSVWNSPGASFGNDIGARALANTNNMQFLVQSNTTGGSWFWLEYAHLHNTSTGCHYHVTYQTA